MKKEGIEDIIEKYSGTVYGIAIMRLGNRWDADDVFQEVFLAYVRSGEVFQNEEHRKAWLIRTTLNHTKKLLKSSWRQKVDTCEDFKQIGKEPFCFDRQEETDIYETMKKLPDKYCMVLYLYYFEEMSVKEIGSIYNIGESAVKMRLTRAREKMKKELEGGPFYEE